MLDKKALSEINYLVEVKQSMKRIQEEVAELIAPHLMDMDGTQADKYLFSPGHYSGVAKMNLEVYSRGMFAHMVGGDVDFVEMGVFGNEDIMRDKASQEYFAKARLMVVDEMYRNNWFDHVKPSLEYAGALGTDVLTIMGDYFEGNTNTLHWHPGDVFIGEDGRGRVDRLALKIRTTPQDLVDESTDVPESIFYAAQKPKSAKKKIILWGYYRKLPPDEWVAGMKWYYRLIGADGHIYNESYMHSLPGPIWRLEKMPRTAYGMGMGIKLYRDLLQSNKIQKLLMMEAELRVKPPVWIPNRGEDVYMEPGSINYTNVTDGSQVPRRMIDPADMLPASQLKQEIDALTRIHMYTDFFLQLTENTTRRTAQEVAALMMEAGSQVTSLVDSFERNYLNVSVRRHMLIMAEQNRLPEPSRKIQRFVKENPQGQLGIRFIGPLAKARRWMYSVGKDMEMINQMVVPIAQIDPEALDYLDKAALFERGRQFMSGGSEIIKTQEEVDQIRQQRAEAQQQQQQAEAQMAALAQTKAPEPGSPAEAVMNGQ